MYMCESQKYDMEFEVRKRGFEVQKLKIFCPTPQTSNVESNFFYLKIEIDFKCTSSTLLFGVNK